MAGADDHLPDDPDALKAALTETRAKLVGAQALIEHLQLVIAKMQREKFGPRSEKSQRLIEQMELQLEELAAASAEDEAKTEAEARAEVRRLIYSAWTMSARERVRSGNFSSPTNSLPRVSLVASRGDVSCKPVSSFGVLRATGIPSITATPAPTLRWAGRTMRPSTAA